MADGADDRRVWDQLKVLTGLKLPGFNWNANNMTLEFDIFYQTLAFVLEGMEIPKDKWYLYILQQLGREGMERWTTSIEATVNKKDPLEIINAFKKGYELEDILDIPKPLSQQREARTGRNGSCSRHQG